MNPKAKQRSIADKLWYSIGMLKYQYCEVCSRPTNQIHHYFFKGSFGHLRYDLDNMVGLCKGCHFLLHHKDPHLIEEAIKAKRGEKWYNNLLEKARNRSSSFVSIKWYKDKIEELNNIYKQL